MTESKQNKFSQSSKENHDFAHISFKLDLSPFQLNSNLEQGTQRQEAIRCEKIGLLEDSFVKKSLQRPFNNS